MFALKKSPPSDVGKNDYDTGSPSRQSFRSTAPSTPGSPRRSCNPLRAFNMGGGPDHDETDDVAPGSYPHPGDNHVTHGATPGGYTHTGDNQTLAARRGAEFITPLDGMGGSTRIDTTTTTPGSTRRHSPAHAGKEKPRASPLLTSYPTRHYQYDCLATVLGLTSVWGYFLFAASLPALWVYRDFDSYIDLTVLLNATEDAVQDTRSDIRGRYLLAGIGAAVAQGAFAVMLHIAVAQVFCGRISSVARCGSLFTALAWAGSCMYAAAMSRNLHALPNADVQAEASDAGLLASALLLSLSGGAFYITTVARETGLNTVTPADAAPSRRRSPHCAFIWAFLKENITTLLAVAATAVYYAFGVSVSLWGDGRAGITNTGVAAPVQYDQDRVETWVDVSSQAAMGVSAAYVLLWLYVLSPLFCGRHQGAPYVTVGLCVMCALALLVCTAGRVSVAAEIWDTLEKPHQYNVVSSIAATTLFGWAALASSITTL